MRTKTHDSIDLEYFGTKCQILVSFSEYRLNDYIICVFILSSFSFRKLSNVAIGDSFPSEKSVKVAASNLESIRLS